MLVLDRLKALRSFLLYPGGFKLVSSSNNIHIITYLSKGRNGGALVSRDTDNFHIKRISRLLLLCLICR